MFRRDRRANERERLKKNEPVEELKWDRKSILSLVIFAIFVLVLIAVTQVDVKGYYIRNSSDWVETCGIIMSHEPIDGMRQSAAGNRLTREGCRVEIDYEVEDSIYRAKIFISSFTPFTKEFRNKMYIGIHWPVYYKKTNHEKVYLATSSTSGCK